MSDEREHEDSERTVDRRRLLRRADTVAAGVAGAGVVTAVAAAPAQATDGSPVVQGQTNTGGAASTTIANSSPNNAALALSNGGGGAQLQLIPSAAFDPLTAPSGALAADANGVLWSSVDLGDGFGPFPLLVYTTLTANITVPLDVPQRVLDTRTSAGRANILNPSGNLDSSGRLIAKKTINLNLSSYVDGSQGVLGNLTVVTPTGSTFATVFAYGTSRPSTSNINYNANSILSNFTMSAVGWDPTNDQLHDVISIYSNATTHVIFDLMAVIVQDRGQILKGTNSFSASRSLAQGQAQRQELALKRARQRTAG